MSKWREAFTKLWFLLLVIICDEGQKKSKDLQLCLYNAFAVSKEKNHFIFIRQSSTTSIFIVLARLWHQSELASQKFNDSNVNEFAKFLSKEPCSLFDSIAFFTHIMPDLVQKMAFLGSKFCPVCELCSFTLTL